MSALAKDWTKHSTLKRIRVSLVYFLDFCQLSYPIRQKEVLDQNQIPPRFLWYLSASQASKTRMDWCAFSNILDGIQQVA